NQYLTKDEAGGERRQPRTDAKTAKTTHDHYHFPLARLRDRIDHDRLAGLDDLHGPLQRGAELVWIVDGSDALHAQRLGERREVDIRVLDLGPDRTEVLAVVGDP